VLLLLAETFLGTAAAHVAETCCATTFLGHFT